VPTPAEAIRARAEQGGGTVVTAQGCEVYGRSTEGFAEAEAVALESDAVVCIIGGKSMKGYGVGWGSEEESILTCGEGCDMHDLTPGGPQLELARRLIATGKPVTVVMIDGRPETLFDVADQCTALVAAWYPGEEGSTALAELLFGDANFAGKLPVTFPRHVGQLPVTHDRTPSGGGFYHAPGTPDRPGRDYVFGNTHPAFEFGYGLGYSRLEYRAITAEAVSEGIRVTVTVENCGDYPADESVPVFLRDEVASIPQPQKKLVAIGALTLAPGETATAELLIPTEALTFTNARMERVLEPGWFTVMAGGLEARVQI
jgi:beta-glucosidase